MVQRRPLRGHRELTFHGSACMAIQDGSVVEIDIVYGCNMPPVG